MTPLESEVVIAGLGAVAGGLVTYASRVYFDWQKNGRSNGNQKSGANGYGRKCVDHEACIVGLTNIKHEAEEHARRLDRGDKRMERIEGKIDETVKTVNGIDKNLGALVSRLNANDAIYQSGRKSSLK